MNSIIDTVILISVVGQVGLLVYALIHSSRLKTGRIWLPTTLGLQIAATGCYVVCSSRLSMSFPAAPATLLLIATLTAFSGMVAADLTRQRSRLFVGIGIGWAVLYTVLSLLFASTDTPASIVAAVLALSPPELGLMAGFGAIGLLLLALAFYVFYVNPLPEISNRAIFWVFSSMVVLMGFPLAVSGSQPLALLGLLTLTIGMASATYSQVSYSVFDIRALLGGAFRLLLLITAVAAILFFAFNWLDSLQLDTPLERTLLAGLLAIAIAIFYIPMRELANYLLRRLLIGESIDAVDATKRYSQELARAIEIHELIEIASKTLNSVLRVRRSGMLLVSRTLDTGIELTTMRGGGFGGDQPQSKVTVPLESTVYDQIVLKQKPVTQFDIVFNPAYETLGEDVRDYFRKLDMSAYAPIIMDGAIIGLLACGTKLNDTPLYERDLQLLVALANQTGVALRNTRLVADLRHLNKSMQMLNSHLGDANERMGKLDSVKTDFVTIASHELRTPLAQVRGYTDIIDALNDQGMLNQDQTRGLVNNLRKATERMEELISAMLDVSQLDVNAMDLRFAQTSPESVLRMAIEPLTDPIKQRKLTLSARGLRGLPTIEADMQRLVQAFRNIITNAIKFTPDGGRIDIRARHQTAEETSGDEYILISVADTGIGVAPEHIELIFNKFYRAADPGLHSTGTYKFMGAGPGLGLTIAKGVIDGHGGRIWAESPGYDPQKFPGSTFYVQLPLVPPEHARRVLPFEENQERETHSYTRTQEMQATSS